MKIFGKENGIDVLYVQIKDLNLLGISFEIKNIDNKEMFVKIEDKKAIVKLYNNSKIVNFNESIMLNIDYLNKKINGLKELDDKILDNYCNDLISIYEYKMGRKKLNLPSIINDSSSFKAEADGIWYIISRCVDPFKISLTKSSGKQMRENDMYPSQSIEMFIALVARSIGLQKYVGYEVANISLSDDRKTIFLEIKFRNYVNYMESLEEEMNKQKSQEEKRKNSLCYKVLSKIGIFSLKK